MMIGGGVTTTTNLKSTWQSMKRLIPGSGLKMIPYKPIAQMRCQKRKCIIGTSNLFKTRHIES